MEKDYEYNLKMYHEESPAVYNNFTKEITVFNTRRSKRKPVAKDADYVMFKSVEKYHRNFDKAWTLLETLLADDELGVVSKIARRSTYKDSLLTFIPNEELSFNALEKELGTDRRKLKVMFEKFLKLGIVGRFDIGNKIGVMESKWIFNPYISFNGEKIHKDIKSLFKNTLFCYE